MLGVLDVLDEDGALWDQFKVEIHRSQEFPYRFPKLYEVGGRIPHSQDWHVYVTDEGPKKSCCITVPPIEFIQCKNSISAIRFIAEHATPYLYKQAYRLKYGLYPGKEYAHGVAGIFEYYSELLGIRDTNRIIALLDTYSKKLHKKSSCFCGSGSKFRNCHREAYQSIKSTGPDFVENLKNIILLSKEQRKL